MAGTPSMRVRADVFPAIISVAPADSPNGPATLSKRTPEDHRYLEKTRVVVTVDTLLIFQDSSSGPELIFSERIADYTPPPPNRTLTIRTRAGATREALVTLDSGKTVAFTRQQGCGCGSRLKSFDPFKVAYGDASSASAPTSAASNRDL